jgi:hypothetical protein
MRKLLALLLLVLAPAFAADPVFRIDVDGLDLGGKVKITNGKSGDLPRISPSSWRPEADRPFSLTALSGAVPFGKWKKYELSFTAENDGIVTVGLLGDWAQNPDDRQWIIVGAISRDGGAPLDFNNRAFNDLNNIDGFRYERGAEFLPDIGIDDGPGALCNHDNRLAYVFRASAGKTYNFAFTVKPEADRPAFNPMLTAFRVDLAGLDANGKVRLTPAQVGGGLPLTEARWRPEAERPYGLNAVAAPFRSTSPQRYTFAFKPLDSGIVEIAIGGEWAQEVDKRAWVIVSAIFNGKEKLPLFVEGKTGADAAPVKELTLIKDASIIDNDGVSALLVNHDSRVAYHLPVKAEQTYAISVLARPASPPPPTVASAIKPLTRVDVVATADKVRLTVGKSDTMRLTEARHLPEAERPFAFVAYANAPLNGTKDADYDLTFTAASAGKVTLNFGAEWAQKVEDRAWNIVSNIVVDGQPLDLESAAVVLNGKSELIYAADGNVAGARCNHDARLSYTFDVEANGTYSVKFSAREE